MNFEMAAASDQPRLKPAQVGETRIMSLVIRERITASAPSAAAPGEAAARTPRSSSSFRRCASISNPWTSYQLSMRLSLMAAPIRPTPTNPIFSPTGNPSD